MGQSYLLTSEIAQQAINLGLAFFKTLVAAGLVKRDMIHIVVMDPAALYDPSTPFEEAILCEGSIGDPSTWEHDYKEIARAKALQAWKFGIPNQIILERMPYLLKDHDTRHYGSAIKDGIVVAASGVEPHFDQLVSEVTASTCQALCIHKMTAIQKEDKGDTLDGLAWPVVGRTKTLEARSAELGVTIIDLEKEVPNPAVVALVDHDIIKRHKALPVEIRNGFLVVAMVDPSNLMAIDDICLATGYDVAPRLCSEADFGGAILELFASEENRQLRDRWFERTVTLEEAVADSPDPEELERLIARGPQP